MNNGRNGLLGASVWSMAIALLGCGAAGVSSQGAAAQSVDVEVQPPGVELLPVGRVRFAASVSGTIDTSVTWEVVEAAGGAIDSSGLYRAPQALGTYHVRAISRAAPSAQGTAVVTVTATPTVAVTVSPNPGAVPVGGSMLFTAAVTGAADDSVTWSVQETAGCGSITQGGTYVPPATPATCHVVATSQADPTKSAVASVEVTVACWSLAEVNRVRLQPRPGQAAAMVGGSIQGSNDGPTNGFVVLATVDSPPVEGQWTDIRFSNATPYRYVKYYGPPGSYGQVAELEFYSGAVRTQGTGFGTAGSRSGNPWQNALDGDPATFFEGLTANDVYVGIDAAGGQVVATPTFSPPAGSYDSAQVVTISTTTSGAAIRYTTDGSDPAVAGRAYTGPVSIGSGATTLRAIATRSCMLASPVAMAPYSVSTGGGTAQASIHIGNSLTDSLEGYLQPLAVSGGVTLDYSRYTVPGAGTYVYEDYATGGFGVSNVQTTVRTKPFDHLSMQPAANMPCLPTGYASQASAGDRSDAVNIDGVWNDAVGPNPAVQIWVYSTWPGPTAYSTCLTGGAWLRDPAIWNPANPTSWEDAVSHMTQFNEAVRAWLAAAHPSRPAPYIVPAGMALVNLKHAVEGGSVPGIGTSGFWTLTFQQGQGADDHLTNEGRYLVSLVFYAAMFQQSPAGLPHANTSLTDAQAAVFQDVAWQTVSGYPLSGIGR